MLQAGAIPYRVTEDQQVEFCLVTSVNKGRWIFPKGIIDPGETPIETALKEAFEEAGVGGVIEGPPLGHYEYAKWDMTLRVTVLLMRVSEVAADWPEAQQRQRRWASYAEARQLIEREDLRSLLDLAWIRLRPPGDSGGESGQP